MYPLTLYISIRLVVPCRIVTSIGCGLIRNTTSALRTMSERSFLSFLGHKFVPILPHENWGRTSRKIKKPPNSHPKLIIFFVVRLPHFNPLKNI